MGRLVFILILLIVYESKAETSDGSPCQDCDENTVCRNNECQCDEHLIGDPYFQCYHSHSIICRMYSDPILENFQGQHVALTPLGSFKVAQFTTLSDHGGQCKFTMWAWSERVKGKFYLKGIQVKLKQVNEMGQVQEDEYRVRSFIDTSTGIYSWVVEEKMNGDMDFSFTRNVSSEDTNTTFALYNFDCPREMTRTRSMFLKDNIMCCGIMWGLRAYNPNSTIKVPGMFLIVDQEFSPTFEDLEQGKEPVCLGIGNQTIKDLKQTTGLSARDAISYLSFTNGGLTDYDNAPAIEDVLTSVLTGCHIDDLNQFFKSASFIWKIPRFVRCISQKDGQDDLMDLIFQASLWFCKGLKMECIESKAVIMDSCGHLANTYPEVSDYLNMSCDT